MNLMFIVRCVFMISEQYLVRRTSFTTSHRSIIHYMHVQFHDVVMLDLFNKVFHQYQDLS